MSDLEHARLLLAMAEKDLKALRGMGNQEIFSDEIFGFHAQQSVEKALKGWLTVKGVAYPRTHDLGELMALLHANNVELPESFLGLADLADFAVQYRYELAEDLGEKLDRAAIIDRVSQLLEKTRQATSAS
jgi:HEPN domain-containing protein